MKSGTSPHKLNYEQKSNAQKANEAIGSRVPPNSPEAEISLMGALMLSSKSFARVVGIVQGECFYNEKHQLIFAGVEALFERNDNVDILTLSRELAKQGTLKEIGGNLYLAELNKRTPSAANIELYAMIVLEKYLKRQLIEISGGVLVRAYEDTREAMDEIDRAEQMIFELAEKRFSKSYKKMNDLAHETLNYIGELSKRGSSGVIGVSSGLKRLDEMLGGFQNSDLIIIAARPSMGKTALGLSIALNAGVRKGIPLAFFSIEMASNQIAIRLISAEARINQQNVRAGRLSNDEHREVIHSLDRLSKSPIFIDDSGMLSVLELRAKARRLKSEHKIQMIIVDYLQLMHSPKAESREREISVISSTLKQIAKELEIPVVALAQLNRSVESRPGKDKRPMLSDLRESGSIEQDADVVMFVNRPERYNIREFEDGASTENMAEIIVAKQRNGPVGTIRAAFLKNYALFANPLIGAEDKPYSSGSEYSKYTDYGQEESKF